MLCGLHPVRPHKMHSRKEGMYLVFFWAEKGFSRSTERLGGRLSVLCLLLGWSWIWCMRWARVVGQSGGLVWCANVVGQGGGVGWWANVMG